MKDTKKMVLLSWDKWEDIRKKSEDKNMKSVVKVDVGVQTIIFEEEFHSLQGSSQIGKNLLAGEGDELPRVSLPSPPAEFVKAYFEDGGKDTPENIDKISQKRDVKRRRLSLGKDKNVVGKWVNLK